MWHIVHNLAVLYLISSTNSLLLMAIQANLFRCDFPLFLFYIITLHPPKSPWESCANKLLWVWLSNFCEFDLIAHLWSCVFLAQWPCLDLRLCGHCCVCVCVSPSLHNQSLGTFGDVLRGEYWPRYCLWSTFTVISCPHVFPAIFAVSIWAQTYLFVVG